MSHFDKKKIKIDLMLVIFVHQFLHCSHLLNLACQLHSCTAPNGFALYSMCCWVMLLSLYIYIYGPKYICDYYSAYWI